jgi:hypothetical protein
MPAESVVEAVVAAYIARQPAHWHGFGQLGLHANRRFTLNRPVILFGGVHRLADGQPMRSWATSAITRL